MGIKIWWFSYLQNWLFIFLLTGLALVFCCNCELPNRNQTGKGCCWCLDFMALLVQRQCMSIRFWQYLERHKFHARPLSAWHQCGSYKFKGCRISLNVDYGLCSEKEFGFSTFWFSLKFLRLGKFQGWFCLYYTLQFWLQTLSRQNFA